MTRVFVFVGFLGSCVACNSNGGSPSNGPPTGTANQSNGPGTAPPDNVQFTGTFASGAKGSSTVPLTVDGVVRSVDLYVPQTLPANPPLIIALHGTGGTPSDFIYQDSELAMIAERDGVVLAGPQALERNGGRGEVGDPDHYDGGEGWPTSWNMTAKTADANNDVKLLRAIIEAAKQAYGVNTDRVYLLGHSNGAFFSYFAAMMMPDRIAAFAENAGGAIRCQNRESENGGAQFTGTATTCAGLKAQPGYPSCTGALQPVAVPGTRYPPGYLAHAIDDDVVSVAWTCTLAEAMGPRANVYLQQPYGGMQFGHAIVDGFLENGWAYMKGFTRSD